MTFFKKNTTLLDLMNKFNSMENKIDILQSKMETSCNCSEHENKIYNNLQNLLEIKFGTMKNDIINNIPTNTLPENNFLETIKQIITETHETHDKHMLELTVLLNNICKKSDPIVKDQLQDQITVLYNSVIKTETHDKHLSELISILTDICNRKDCNITESQLQGHITTLYSSIIKTYSQFDDRIRSKIDDLNTSVDNTIKTNDSNLRNNLQDIIISIKNDIITNINNSKDTSNLDNFIKNITEQINTINDKVNSFYFENETVKHQFSLEQDIREYGDDIDQLKILITNIKLTIDETLKINNFEYLKTKYK